MLRKEKGIENERERERERERGGERRAGKKKNLKQHKIPSFFFFFFLTFELLCTATFGCVL